MSFLTTFIAVVVFSAIKFIVCSAEESAPSVVAYENTFPEMSVTSLEPPTCADTPPEAPVFVVEKSSEDKDCSWLANQNAAKISFYCNSFDGISRGCRKVCANCGENKPPCKNEKGYDFKLADITVESCLYVAESTKTSKLCDWSTDVQAKCALTCGTCTHVPTIAPSPATAVPSFMPSSTMPSGIGVRGETVGPTIDSDMPSIMPSPPPTEQYDLRGNTIFPTIASGMPSSMPTACFDASEDVPVTLLEKKKSRPFQNCEWLEDSKGDNVVEKYCNNFRRIRKGCPKACGICEGQKNCRNDKSILFPKANFIDSNCKALRDDYAPTVMAEFCDDSPDAREKCPETCGECGQDTEVFPPSMMVSDTPSAMPEDEEE